ncbi:MAG: ABC transporter permease [Atribacteria sp.]|nr:ABC transporter permease [Candidatus Atribacteria bacterium]MBU4047021.1 ABC transporter permease [bacterium]
MLKYVIKRILWIVPTVLGVLILLFSLTYFLPGDPASVMLGPRATPELIEDLNHRLHLDQPVYTRLGYYILGVLRGDLGESVWSGHKVSSLIVNSLPYTIILAVCSMGLAALVGIFLGVFATIYKESIIDHLVTGISLVGVAVPDFVAACLLLLFFAVHLNLFPVLGAGEAGNIADKIHHLILPVISLAIGWIGYLSRLTRETMLEVLDSDYIRVEKAFGIPAKHIHYKYALKNAVIPIITVIGLGIGKLLGGAVLVEIIFNRPGLGKLVVDAVYARDLPVVQGGILIATLLFVLANLIADISYAYIDPRIQYE